MLESGNFRRLWGLRFLSLSLSSGLYNVLYLCIVLYVLHTLLAACIVQYLLYRSVDEGKREGKKGCGAKILSGLDGSVAKIVAGSDRWMRFGIDGVVDDDDDHPSPLPPFPVRHLSIFFFCVFTRLKEEKKREMTSNRLVEEEE